MWHTLAEEQSQHFSRICKFWGDGQVKMEIESNDHKQPKQERSRTRWTADLDRVFADIVVDQIQQGNRPNNVFDKKTWNLIREKFNGYTNLSFNNNQLRKHLDVLRTRYYNLQSVYSQNDAVQDPCYVGFDLWEDIGVHAQSKIEPVKTKECPIYEQLCAIFADSGVDGKYAQSSHYEGLDKPAFTDQLYLGGNPSPKVPPLSKSVQGDGSSPQNIRKNLTDKKRKRPSESVPISELSNCNQELGSEMAKALLEMIESSKLRTGLKPEIVERFTITNCIKALDEIEGIEDGLYYASLDLFEKPTLREMFLSLKSSYVRLTWLQGKCRNFSQSLEAKP